MHSELPIDISGEEKIVRLIRTPAHVKNDKLKPAAFRSMAGTDEVSVVRQTYMGSDFCKTKGKEIMADAYIGLAIILCQNIRNTGSAIQDSREEFCGHAHIAHGVILEREEPPESELNLFITERCRQLVTATTLHIDPDPTEPRWTGPEL